MQRRMHKHNLSQVSRDRRDKNAIGAEIKWVVIFESHDQICSSQDELRHSAANKIDIYVHLVLMTELTQLTMTPCLLRVWRRFSYSPCIMQCTLTAVYCIPFLLTAYGSESYLMKVFVTIDQQTRIQCTTQQLYSIIAIVVIQLDTLYQRHPKTLNNNGHNRRTSTNNNNFMHRANNKQTYMTAMTSTQ